MKYFYTTRHDRLEWLPPRQWDVKCPKCGSRAMYYTDCVRSVWKGRVKETKAWAAEQRHPFTLAPSKGETGWWRLTWFPLDVGENEEGVVYCRSCAKRWSYTARWPDDAWYRVAVIDQELWSYNRDQLVLLREYMAATSRAEFKASFGADAPRWFQKLPRKLVSKKYKAAAVDAIDRFLEDDGLSIQARRKAT